MKIYIFLILILTLLFPNIIFGFFSNPAWIDLYKKIDSWIYELELKYISKELKNDKWDIAENLNLNYIADDEWCKFKNSLTESDIIEISNNNIEKLALNLDWCFDENWNIPISIISKFSNLTKQRYIDSSIKAKNKIDSINKISKIWLYSDWIKENSPFDLISDLQDINSIIFEEKYEYKWVNNHNIQDVVDNILWWESIDNAMALSQYNSIKDNSITNSTNNSTTNTTNSKKNQITWINIKDWNNQVCDNSVSWLDPDIIDALLKPTPEVWNTVWNSSLTQRSSSSSPPNEINNANPTSTQNTIKDYKKVNDNSKWPCNDFFCITIEFVMYNHNLLGWWTNLSIEWLIKRSNDHLKKFAWTSLVQWKMAINNFEIWLKDLNLPDLFHVWVVVSHKPVPIVNLDKKDKNEGRDETDFSSKNLLERYYKSLWLDYKRSNDLTIFKQTESELKTMLDTQELSIWQIKGKEEDLQKIREKAKKEISLVSEIIIDKKIIHEDMNDFYKQFSELESFIKAMMDYSISTNWIIKGMKAIPIWW